MRGQSVRDLAAYLTGSEAAELADHLAADETWSQAFVVVSQARRTQVRQLLTDAFDPPPHDPPTRDMTVAVLRAIEGAHAHTATVTPVWTVPGGLVRAGQLTASVHHLVSAARESVICSTFNFQRSSALWTTLREVASRPEVTVRVYVDSDAADRNPAPWQPTTNQIATELAPAMVWRTTPTPNGNRPRNHAKFVAIDHQFLLVTSANFSASAEQHNIELGLRIDDPILTRHVEHQMRALEPLLYERVPAG
ncbi:MAG: DISARM system phospholipase D-like protein DrmC [Micrococcales bacterium]|nr:DISARM system phospholipase D-like protein DrmC [Micrococcales bacterium]MCL2668710.1 DISARM system phospholipase D-like protein DrmC [Micrococcales bacterium]